MSRKHIDPNSLKAQTVHVNAAGSMLTAIDMGLIPATEETISTVCSTLREVADWLEANMKGGEENANP